MSSSTSRKDRIDRIADALGKLLDSLKSCQLCPLACGVDRSRGTAGACGAGLEIRAFRAAPHHGEEPPISGSAGSGVVFFSGCALRCLYCQNYRFSQENEGTRLTPSQLSQLILKLQQSGCHNLNLVTATHYLPQTLEAILLATDLGFRLPIVYNTSSYESQRTLELLGGIVDIYLADLRYADDSTARNLSGAPDYTRTSREAVRTMSQQVGPLRMDEGGIASRGLIVRFLVLPGLQQQAIANLHWLAENVSTDLAVSVMGQYTPTSRVLDHPLLGRRVTTDEYESVLQVAEDLDFETVFVQYPSVEMDERLLGENMEPNL